MQKRLQTKTPSQSQVAHSEGLRSRPMEEPATADVAPLSATESSAKVKHHFGNIPVQAKLTIGAPDDQYEQEADRVADQVMSASPTANPVQRQTEDDELQMKPLASSITPLVQREAMPEEEDELQTKPIQREMESEEEEPVQTKPIQREAMPEEEETLQTKSTVQRSSKATAGTPDLETRLSHSQGSGNPLPKDTQQFMESRFGTNFSHVKIHTGSEAVQMNREIGAQAFTHGSNVYFGAGKFDPGSDSGKHLLAHELTHVVQQTGAAASASIQQRSQISTLQRRRRGTTADAPASEQTAIDATGRYEAIDPDGNNRFTLQINQAGRHFEGWQQRRAYRSVSGQRLISQRLVGTLVSSNDEQIVFNYQRFSEGGDTTYEGRFTVRADGTATRSESNGWAQDFRRTSRSARLSDEAIAASPEETRALVQATETAPLDTEEEARLERGCTSIRTLIEQYLDATRQSIVRDSYASRINSHINSLMRPHAPEQMPLVRRRMQQHLLQETFQSGSVTRPYWDWLQVIVSAHPRYTEGIQNRLGMSPDGISGEGTPQHRYRWMFSTIGLAGDVGVGLGGFLGVFVIEKLAPDQWRQQYFTVMGGASGGLSAGVTVGQTTNWSEFETPFPWTSGNFRGAYAVTGAAGAGSFGVGGGYTPGAMISFYGVGSFPVLSGDASGFAAVYGAYIGAEASVTSGYLWGGREEAIRSARHQEVTSQSSYSADARVHFEVDDPSLTEMGRDRIRQMCATHRVAFENPNSVLRIYGYTSTTGSDRRNQQLSDLQAQNTLQAIYDVLGSAVAIPPENQSVLGFGETPARTSGLPDRTEDESWRKVEVQLNGRTVTTLR